MYIDNTETDFFISYHLQSMSEAPTELTNYSPANREGKF